LSVKKKLCKKMLACFRFNMKKNLSDSSNKTLIFFSVIVNFFSYFSKTARLNINVFCLIPTVFVIS